MNLSIYEILRGHFMDGSAIESFNENNQIIKSVLDNVQRILNSRQGSLKHLPDYGIPDLSSIYCHLPASAHSLREEMILSILKYEPRITNLDVILLPSKEKMVLYYQLCCSINKINQLVIDAYFFSNGSVDVCKYDPV